jgi:putative membrane protein
MGYWTLMCYALAGTAIASLLACIPALHVYNVAGLLLLLLARPEVVAAGIVVPASSLAMLLLGMVVGYAVVNTIPSIFWAAPDESAVWIVLPGQNYLMQRRGYEAAILSGIGSLGAALALLLVAPLAGAVLAPIRRIVQPHVHWVLGLVTLYVILSEWPKGIGRGETVLSRLWDGWRSLVAGLATFVLSGLLGLFLAFRPLVDVYVSFQSLMPAFVGLFAVPWVIQNILSGTRIPDQHVCRSVDVTFGLVVRGVAAGALGGLLAAFFPVISGGMGGLIAGHATAQRDERAFIISQGASKFAYYVGALLFFFAPGLHLTRGGMAWMLSPLYQSYALETYWQAVGIMALCAVLAFGLLLWLSKGAISLIARIDYRWLSWGTLGLLIGLVFVVTGWQGLLIACTATGIGLIPILFHSRRMNCMGVLLVPILLNMAGWGPAVAEILGLL